MIPISMQNFYYRYLDNRLIQWLAPALFVALVFRYEHWLQSARPFGFGVSATQSMAAKRVVGWVTCVRSALSLLCFLGCRFRALRHHWKIELLGYVRGAILKRFALVISSC